MHSNFTTKRTSYAKKKTAKKGTKSTKRTKTTSKAKKSNLKIHPGWTIEDYRDAHKQIPGKIYKAEASPTKTVKKTNYAPLGRPRRYLSIV